MPIQRESDIEDDDNESVSELPIIIPKYQVSQQKLDHLARARQRKAELAQERAGQPTPKQEMRAKEREETLALSRGVKKIKDPVAKEAIKKEILKATTLRQPKVAPEPTQPPPPPASIQKTRKQPQVVLEESEPEIIYVKVPKKKIVVEQSETETEAEVKPKSARRRARPQPVETESEYESEYDAPPTRKKQAPAPAKSRPALKPPTAFPGFTIHF